MASKAQQIRELSDQGLDNGEIAEKVGVAKQYVRQIKWCAKNSEHVKAQQKEWRAKNREHARESGRRHYANNRERIKTQMREKYKQNPEEHRERQKKMTR